MFIWKEKKKLKSSLAFCFLLLIKFYINLGALESGYSPCRVHSYRSASLFHAFLTGEVLGQPYSLACFMVSIPGEKKLPLTKYFLFISHSLFQAGTGKLQATSLGLFNKNVDLPRAHYGWWWLIHSIHKRAKEMLNLCMPLWKVKPRILI